MITTTIQVYDDYVAITGDREFNPRDWQYIYDYYEDEGIDYDLDEEGPFSKHWTKYDDMMSAIRDNGGGDYLDELLQDKENGEYDDDEFEDEVKDLMDDIFEFYLEFPEGYFIVKDPE